ncbi:hydrolase [Pseudomonas tohonis]|uniref:Hydrolase n=1 Tax=Pseudomonas tohonis TaxID=2725477 RepID=A0A6J4DYZ0_9PSED|nr:isochorismatase family protein [Pseudomonas tohonis]BCG22737.1 hydrolase [Pseudomonas tohonis]GJN55003.1 hydrolase [Pseudomonas tohonis]
MIPAIAQPDAALLAPDNHLLVLLDHQAQPALATRSIDAITLRDNLALLAKAAWQFEVPTLLSSLDAPAFAGELLEELTAVFPEQPVLRRRTFNAWEDAPFIERVNASGQRRLVLAGLWTSVSITATALSALGQGFAVYLVVDAGGDVSPLAQETGLQRLLQRGVQPLTSLQYLLELQRDWSRTATAARVLEIARTHGGPLGL